MQPSQGLLRHLEPKLLQKGASTSEGLLSHFELSVLKPKDCLRLYLLLADGLIKSLPCLVDLAEFFQQLSFDQPQLEEAWVLQDGRVALLKRRLCNAKLSEKLDMLHF